MAAENRTALQATLDALSAVVTLADLKTAFTNFVDSMLMKRDVQNLITVAGAGTTNVNFASYDTIKVSTGYDCTLNIQNISDGDVKFLWLSKNADIEVDFTGATSQEIDTTYTKTLTNIVFMVTKKYYGTVILVPLTTTFDHSDITDDIDALETRIGTNNFTIVDIGSWDMDASLTKSVTHGLTFSKIKSWQVTIINDDGNGLSDFISGGAISVTTTQFTLVRTIGGAYDNTNFDDSVMNRGYITIWYTD